MKCFIYCRQSVSTSSDPDDSMSLETQKNECLRLTKAKGLNVLEVFREPDTSGRLYPVGFEALAIIDSVYQRWLVETKKTGKWRPQLGKMLKRLNEVDYIVCYDLTRFHRSLNGSFLENMLIQTLSSANVKLLTVKEGEIDFSRFQDSLISTLTSQINAEQLRITKEKSKASMHMLKANGEWSGACFKSFGYRSTGRKREVEIDEEKAEIVKTVFRMYIEGQSFWYICKAVNQVLWVKWKRTFTKVHIARMLKNPIYCGYYYGDNNELIKAKPNAGKEIISFSTWKTAQEILAHRKVHPKRASVNWLPLSGKVYCGICGETMRVMPTGRTVQYRCFSYSKHGFDKSASCKNGVSWTVKGSIECGDIMQDALMGLLPIYYMSRLEAAEADTSRMHEIEDAEITLINLQSKMQTMTQAFLDGTIDDSVYKPAINALSKKSKEAKEKIDELKRVANAEDYTATKLLFDIEALNAGDVEQIELEEAFRWVFKKVVIFPNYIEAHTPKGIVKIPTERRGQKLIKCFPYHWIFADKKSADIVYNWKSREINDAEDVIDYEKEGKLIADFGRVRIWII